MADHSSTLNRQIESDDLLNARRPVTRVFRRLLLAGRFVSDVVDDVAKKHGLSSGEFMVLMSVHRWGGQNGIRPTELYQLLLVTSGAISKRLDKLEKLDLIERIEGGKDGRSLPVRVTSKGETLAIAVRTERNAMHDVADEVGEADMEALDRLLRQYLKAIEKVTGRK